MGGDGYKSSDASMATWNNPGDLEFVYEIQWQRVVCKVDRIQEADSAAIVTMQQPYFRALADALVRGCGWQRRFCVALAYRFHTPVSQALFSGAGFEGVIG